MGISAGLVKELRNRTGLGIMDCKQALEACAGDLDKAVEYLRKMGLEVLKGRIGRATSEGKVGAYVHLNGKIGVLVEVNCETDFVSASAEFNAFVKDLSMQIAATNPISVSREDLPSELVEREKEIYRQQIKGKPAPIVEKIIAGKMEKFYEENCLLDQPFIKDDRRKVADLLHELVAKTGENIVVRKFARFQVGE